MKRYALIGKSLPHTLSPKIYALLGLSYEAVELKEDELESFLKNCPYDGFNVTIPYKKAVMAYLDHIDPEAERIGAVNTVVVKGGRLYGYNTDIFGMERSIPKKAVEGKDAIVLGSGGTSLTAERFLIKYGAKHIYKVSRSGPINYENIYNLCGAKVLINTTPVGMYPDIKRAPVDIKRLRGVEFVFDAVYNPIRTRLILDCMEMKIECSGGLDMLLNQAFKAAELYTGEPLKDDIKYNAALTLRKDFENIALIGMPSSGKSSLARELDKITGREIVDTDELVEKKAGLKIPEIFEKLGEEKFRDLEEEAVEEACSKKGVIISTGGGAVTREQNIKNLKGCGVVFLIKRDAAPNTSGRPLLTKDGAYERLKKERESLYQKARDFEVLNNDTLQGAAKRIWDLFLEHIKKQVKINLI